jgi:hypothetical protein
MDTTIRHSRRRGRVQKRFYEHIFTTGGPENGKGGYTHDYNTSASVWSEIEKAWRSG